jgi:hypothetical protein
MLQKQKNDNKQERRAKELQEQREQNQYKQEVKLAKKIEKHRGR